MNEKEFGLEQSLKELKELIPLSAQQTDEASCEAIVDEAESIYEKYFGSEELALAYARILFNLSTKQPELNEPKTTVDKLQALHEQFPDSSDIAEAFAMILFNLSLKQSELNEQELTVDKLQALHEHFPDSRDIALNYARILFNLSVKQPELNELKATVDKLQALHEHFPDSRDIAEAFARILFNLSLKQSELNEQEATVDKLQALHEQYPDSRDIAESFAMILFNLSLNQPDLNKQEATVDKLQTLNKQFPNSLDIAETFAIILFNLSLKQSELNKQEATIEKVQELHEDFSKSEIIAFIYCVLLASVFDCQTEVYKRIQITETIKKLYGQFSEFMLQTFDDLFFHNDSICDSEEYKLFNFILKEGLLGDAKYAILKMWAERYKEDSTELKNLLSIYQYVQKIKYQLGLKDEVKKENFKFGHYTKGSVLQSLLEQKEDPDQFFISGKTRLNNANYMNDPEEGIIIEKILGLDRRDILETSSWFLMSFTIKTDDLAMWSQYGDDAQGVCLVLREDDFSRFTSFNDVSWREEIRTLEFINKMDSPISELSSNIKSSQSKSENEESDDTINDEGIEPISEENDNDSKGNVDYLYRIAYINDLDGKFRIEKTELFDDKEIIELETLLESLKKKLDKNLDKKDEFYLKAISDCIEEIRYLFKSVDYKYENELRILRYANLDSENKKIKIDRSSGMGKLYVERENPIQIGEVIFGPKFPNPEYVTPLLKLLDKDIVFKKSMIKFR